MGFIKGLVSKNGSLLNNRLIKGLVSKGGNILTNRLITHGVTDTTGPGNAIQPIQLGAMQVVNALLIFGHATAQVTQAVSGWTGTVMQPVTNYLFSSPECTAADGVCPNGNISYLLYTREAQDSPYRLDPSNLDTIKEAKFVKDVPLKVIIHGYTGNKDYSPNMELRPAYLKHSEYNILTVDWSPLAKEGCYWESAHNVDTVGRCAAELLDLVYETRDDVTLSNTHIIGFSLGAHTAATTASNLKTGKVPRLTGLDPALPLFDDWTNSVASVIDPDDGQFVDVYHSNMGHKGKKAVGGDIDIYLNNGANQPGCNCNRSCDHVRAVEYFAESINSPNGLWGFACWSWSFWNNGFCRASSVEDLVLLGEPISTELRGVYMAFTNSSSPYLLPPTTYIEDKNLTYKVDVSCSWTDIILRGVYMAFMNSSNPYLLPPTTYIEDKNLTYKVNVSCSWTDIM